MTARAPDVVLTLPLPPSANRLQAHTSRAGRAIRYTTSDYRDWQAIAAGEAMLQAQAGLVPWRYELRVTIPEGRIDPDNRIKPVSDILQKCGVIANDRHLRRLELVVDPTRAIDRLLVEIWSLGPAPTKSRRKS